MDEQEESRPPAEIPGCAPWRAAAGAELCPSVHCPRCQQIRIDRGQPVLEPYIGGLDG